MTRRLSLACCLALLGLAFVACPPPDRDPPHKVKCIELDPRVGPYTGGTDVHIVTRGFRDNFLLDPPFVSFGGVPALNVDPISENEVIATTPPDPAPKPGGFHVVDVVVEGAHHGRCVFHDGFKYEGPKAPACLELAPKGDHCDGGAKVEIHTSGFSQDFTQHLPKVWFGGVESPNVDAIDANSLLAEAPPYPNPTPGGRFVVDVVVEAQNGEECVFHDGFVYECPGPSCLHLEPRVGPYTGGTPVQIDVTGFSDDFTVDTPNVFFGGVASPSVTALDRDTVIAETPPDPAPNPGGFHIVDVVVEAVNGEECVFNDGFKYEGPAHQDCLVVDPNKGPLAGGNEVIVKSLSNCVFDNTSKVWFGGHEATIIQVIDPQQVLVEVPAGVKPGWVDVSYLADDGQGNPCDCRRIEAYFYEEPPNQRDCALVDPGRGPLAGGNEVHVLAKGTCKFGTPNNTEIRFGGKTARIIDIISPTEALVEVPAGDVEGLVDVVIIGEDANGRPCDCVENDAYEYVR